MKLTCLFLTAFLAVGFGTHAQQLEEEDDDLYVLSLEELMNIPINVSKADLSLRETPSVLSVITRDEIRSMGARDLMDVLNQVPGFTFGVDVQNVIGLGARGNWGHEGKVLLLIDGQEMNEIIFSTTQFGQHYDINNIERIEIIRGPGSSIYGGYAELGVINIITRSGGSIQGSSWDLIGGYSGSTRSRTAGSFSIGNKSENIEYSIAGSYGSGIRSDQPYTDIYGSTADMTSHSDLKPLMLNVGIKDNNFSARVIYDQYALETIDQFDEILDPNVPDKIGFKQLIAETKYDWKVNEKLIVTPKVNIKDGTPWETGVNGVVPYMLEARRIAPSVQVNLVPSSKFNLLAGVDSYFDHAEHTGDVADYFGDLSDNNEISFYDVGLFAQGIIKTAAFNLTLGARFDSHSQFGTAFSPRIGLTKAYDNLHFKLLYSRAFRAPAIENLNYNPDVEPEKTGVAELELGYKLNDNMFITGNLFHIKINDPIVYFVDVNNPVGTYDNFSAAGSMGFELDYRVKYPWGYVNLNYSSYSAKGINEVPYYQVPGNENQVLAMPGSRVNAAGSYNVTESFSINPSLNYLGRRNTVSGEDINGYLYSELESELFVNLYLRYKMDNFDLGAGVYDLLNEGQKFVQPYASGHLVLPGLGREFIVRVAYTISRK